MVVTTLATTVDSGQVLTIEIILVNTPVIIKVTTLATTPDSGQVLTTEIMLVSI